MGDAPLDSVMTERQPRPRSPWRGWSRLIVSLILAALIILLWVRSYRHADYGVLFVPGGAAQGAASLRGRVLVVFSNISFGRDHELLHAIPQDYLIDQQAGISDPIGMTGSRLEVEVYLVTVLISAVRAMLGILSGGSLGDVLPGLRILAAFDVVFLVVGYVVFEFILEE